MESREAQGPAHVVAVGLAREEGVDAPAPEEAEEEFLPGLHDLGRIARGRGTTGSLEDFLLRVEPPEPSRTQLEGKGANLPRVSPAP
jgi:hypothetical protein